jgi:hypothetical protein
LFLSSLSLCEPLLQLRHERRQRCPERPADRAHLDQVEPHLAAPHLAVVGLALADALGELHLGNAGGPPRLPLLVGPGKPPE